MKKTLPLKINLKKAAHYLKWLYAFINFYNLTCKFQTASNYTTIHNAESKTYNFCGCISLCFAVCFQLITFYKAYFCSLYCCKHQIGIFNALYSCTIDTETENGVHVFITAVDQFHYNFLFIFWTASLELCVRRITTVNKNVTHKNFIMT